MASSLDAPWLTGAWSTTALALCMASHERLGESSPLRLVASHADLLRCIMRFIELIVPDDAPLLAAAIARAAPGQRILLRRGEHHIDCGAALQPLSALPLAIRGEVGAVVRGTLVLGAGGGSIHGVRFDDAGGDCLRCVGGQWLLARLRLRCSHGCALRLSGGAQVTLERCTLGGESEQEMGTSVVMLSAYGSVQEAGIRKTACYALVLRNKARDISPHISPYLPISPQNSPKLPISHPGTAEQGARVRVPTVAPLKTARMARKGTGPGTRRCYRPQSRHSARHLGRCGVRVSAPPLGGCGDAFP